MRPDGAGPPSPGPGAALAVGFDGTALPEDVQELAARGGLGGVVLFARNCPDLETVLALTAAVRRLSIDTLVLVDHEGGRVHRLPPPFTRFPSAGALGRAGDPRLAARVARAMARELRAAGFDSGLSPVVDCRTDPASTVVGDRAFAVDPDAVADCGAAFVEGCLAEGLIPVAKHFPGHGRTPRDSHRELPVVEASREALAAVELRPFRRILDAGCPAVMIAHVRYPALDPARPASLSPGIVTGLLRGTLGFDGLVLTDDLDMAAVADGWGTAAAAVLAIEAGSDLALICRSPAGRTGAAAAVEAAVARGRLRLDGAHRRRAALRRWVRDSSAPPAVAVIGCAEHRDLAEEARRRGGE
jgi:beta-N-acetylhexosaminidase